MLGNSGHPLADTVVVFIGREARAGLQTSGTAGGKGRSFGDNRGFGAAEAGARGSRGVLEVRSHETPFLLEHGQTVARLVFEPLTERPTRLYGEGGGHYQKQGLKLSKHFRPWS
jgi:deoxycytidine triphosphate deaminase